MKKTRPDIIHHGPGADRKPNRINGLNNAVDDVRARLEEVGVQQVEEMEHGVLAAEPHDAEGDVLDDACGCLAVHLVAVDEGVFQERGNGVDVVLGHFADVLEEEGEGFEDAVLHVELGDAVFVHEGREDGEGGAGFGDNADGDRGADSTLAFLDAEVVEEGGEDVLGSDGFGDEAEGVVCRATDAFFVRFEHVEELETDPHPLPRVDTLGSAVCNTTDKIDRVFLHLLVPVPQDRRQSG